MRSSGTQTAEAYVPSRGKEKGDRSWTSKGRKTIHKKVGTANICHAMHRVGHRVRGVGPRALPSSLPTQLWTLSSDSAVTSVIALFLD